MRNHKAEILILGAGAAGLACASYLARSGVAATVLEARSRTGGRIHTLRPALASPPLELGAEFIHGIPEISLGRFEKLTLPFCDVIDDHLHRHGPKLESRPNYFEMMSNIMSMLRQPSGGTKDRSVANFLSASKLSKQKRELFVGFVEGFHAADIAKMSEFGLASTEETDDSNLNGITTFRTIHGYDELIRALEHEAQPATIHLNHEVQEIQWKKGQVVVRTRNTLTDGSQTFEAKRCVITLPIGVLKSSAIQWKPFPKRIDRAVQSIESGHAMRLIFQFESRFWESLSQKPVSYLHTTSDHYFPTWWTFAPMRVPYLVAWQGGPKADDLSKRSEDEVVAIALQTLAHITGVGISKLEKQVTAMFHHNWSHDPYSRGAYSYLATDGYRTWKQLTRPIDETLYFAGEATAEGSARGTVHGALLTGRRSARQIARALKR